MSKYHPDRDSAVTLNAARHWANRCLEADGSIFVDSENLWTPALLDELDRLFIQNLDEGEGTFIQKLKRQLQAGSGEGRKLMAEALWTLMLFQSNISPEYKREMHSPLRVTLPLIVHSGVGEEAAEAADSRMD